MLVCALAFGQYFGYLIDNRIHVQGTCAPSVHQSAPMVGVHKALQRTPIGADARNVMS